MLTARTEQRAKLPAWKERSVGSSAKDLPHKDLGRIRESAKNHVIPINSARFIA